MNEKKKKGHREFFLLKQSRDPETNQFTWWSDAMNPYRSGQVWPTWAPPPPPLNPAPPSRQVLSTGDCRRKQLTDPTTSDRSVRTDDRRPLDEQEKLVPVYTSSTAPAPHMMPFCTILLYWISTILWDVLNIGISKLYRSRCNQKPEKPKIVCVKVIH